MKPIRGEYLILIAIVMMVLGVVLPLLMVLGILESTFFLNFFSFGMQVAGLFLGIIGVAFYTRLHRGRKKGVSEPPDSINEHNRS